MGIKEEMQPLGHWVLLQLDDERTFQVGRLVVGPTSRVFPTRMATVLKVGPGNWNRAGTRRLPTGLEPGMRVAMLRTLCEELARKRYLPELDAAGCILVTADEPLWVEAP